MPLTRDTDGKHNGVRLVALLLARGGVAGDEGRDGAVCAHLDAAHQAAALHLAALAPHLLNQRLEDELAHCGKGSGGEGRE